MHLLKILQHKQNLASRIWRAIHRQPKTDSTSKYVESVQNTPDDTKKTKPSLEKRSYDEEVEQGLETIYGVRASGQKRSLSKIERGVSHRAVKVVILLLICLTVICASVLASRKLWQPFQRYSGSGLKMEIHGPTDLILGREQMFVLEWSNETATRFRDTRIRISFPQDFQATSFDPTPTQESLNEWMLGDVLPGARGTMTVKGLFLGSLGSQSAIHAIAIFTPDKYSRGSQSFASHEVAYSDTVLSGNLMLPQKMMVGEQTVIRYVVTNRGDARLSQLAVRMRLPTFFLPATGATTTQLNDSQTTVIRLRDLGSNEFDTAQISGSFLSGASSEAIFGMEAGRILETGTFIPLQRIEQQISLVGGDMNLHLVVNGSDTDQAVESGQPLRLSLEYQNTSPTSLTESTISLIFESVVDNQIATSSLLALSKADDTNKGTTSTNGSGKEIVKYSHEQIPALKNLAAQSSSAIEFGVLTIPVASGTRDALVRVSAEAEISEAKGSLKRKVSVRPITVRYRSNARAGVEARYFTEEGAPYGSGPLPPIAGQATTYRIFWHASKEIHTLLNTRFVTVLPKNIAWGNHFDAEMGTVQYDEKTRAVSWSVPVMSDNVQELNAWFDISLTPDPLDIGRFASLLNETRFETTDSVLQQPISIVKQSLTTDLQNDEGARRKGVVKER